jgi:hypothetical protein
VSQLVAIVIIRWKSAFQKVQMKASLPTSSTEQRFAVCLDVAQK